MAMGMLGVLLVWASSNFYRHMVVDNQRAVLSEQMRARLNDWRRELEAESQQLALLVRSESGLVAAVSGKKTDAVVRQLNVLFDRPGTISARVKLAKIQVLDEKMTEFAGIHTSVQLEVSRRQFAPISLIVHFRRLSFHSNV